MVGKYPVITLCSGTLFRDEFMETQKQVTEFKEVLMPEISPLLD